MIVRERIARFLVRFVSRALDRAYACHVRGDEASEALWSRSFRTRQKYVLPVAVRIDRWNAAEQMAREGWWG